MSETESDGPLGDGDGRGVFESLPRRRVGRRSPRRPRVEAPEPGRQGPQEGHGLGLEGLARASLTAASEVASLGLRLAGRAASEIRGIIDRR